MPKGKVTGLTATRRFVRGRLVVEGEGKLSKDQLALLDPETAEELKATGLLKGDPDAATGDVIAP